ncbi:MAG: hypothetical protein JW755_00275 [Candidatus Aminicenantes bacterium]|nr:hypothetical protein [Candidatus Aminicenantes bacterium]
MLHAEPGRLVLGGLILCLIITLIFCKSPIAPKNGEADILIANDINQTLDIYLNGDFKYSLPYGHIFEIDNVALGSYKLEAMTQGTNNLLASTLLEITQYKEYTWYIDDQADINVVNNSGIDLKIYFDGSYIFDLDDEENRWILNVSHGEHFISAQRVSDGTTFASITIKIVEDTDYTWTIAVNN